jgi:major membrane immunogen (membrane-anchored lipoprotein)
MKKSVFAMAVAAALMLSACGQVDRSLAAITGGASKSCVDGVTYLQFTSGSTVQVDRTGKPVPCN